MSEQNGKRKGRQLAKRLVVILLFLAFLAAVVLGLNDVLRKKWIYESNAAQQIVQGFYKEDEDSIDVLCLGASTMRNGISGLEMYKQYGFTTYSRATSIQLPAVSYHLLRETLETQDIKAGVMDATTVANTILDQVDDTLAGKLHEAIDYMPWSSYKMDLIRETLKMDISASMIDFIFPLYVYHDRWTELEETDFTFRNRKDTYCYKGQYPVLKTVAYAFTDDYMTQDADPESAESFYVDPGLEEYCVKMIELCKERGINFTLVKTPVANWSLFRHDVIEAFAEKNGVEFIDFNLPDIRQEIGFDARTDFADNGKHPNITGARKISDYLGAYLSGACDLEDKRNDPAYASWDRDYEKYADMLTDVELSRETNLVGFLGKLDNPNYITMIATRNDTSQYFNEYVAEGFRRLGVDVPFQDHKCLSYVGILDGASVVYQEMDSDPNDNDNLVSCSMDYDGHSIALSSFASQMVDNSATILFDGKSLAPNGQGFNIVVYDRSVDQVVATKSFNTGISGKNFLRPNPFADVEEDPLAYLDGLSNGDYISLITVSAEGSRYMPGAINDKLAEIGLIPLDKELNRPYIAIMDGAEVVYNAYGEPGEALDIACEVEGTPVAVVSSTRNSDAHIYISVGQEEIKSDTRPGLTLYVYSKSEQRMVTYDRFDWSDNYYATFKAAGKTSAPELMDIARKAGYDALCVYAPGNSTGKPPEAAALALREAGLDVPEGGCYAGILYADGRVEQQSDPGAAQLEAQLDGAPVVLAAGSEGSSATFGDVPYAAKAGELSLYLYDPASRAVLTQARYGEEVPDEPQNLAAARANPLKYLEQLDNEDYIAVLGVNTEGSRYMPGVVNDKLARMGLIPLDGEFNRPYIAVLDGPEVVYNAYGEPGGELSYAGRVRDVEVMAVSSAKSRDGHLYVSVDGEEQNWSRYYTGLTVLVYSKSEGRIVSTVWYTWSEDYLSARKVKGLTNALELLNLARVAGYDVLCVYAQDDADAQLPPDTLHTLNAAGIDGLGEGCYAGILYADGSVEQRSGADGALLEADLEGVEAVLTAGDKGSSATFDGVEYAAKADVLSLCLYDPTSRAVLTQARYTAQVPGES